jgi:hypothetical protein
LVGKALQVALVTGHEKIRRAGGGHRQQIVVVSVWTDVTMGSFAATAPTSRRSLMKRPAGDRATRRFGYRVTRISSSV